MPLTVIGSPNSPNVYLRMNAPDVTSFPNAGGTVNCAWGVGPEELFEVSILSGGTTMMIESAAFPNRFLRVESPIGVVNAQFTAGPWEQFNLQPQSGGGLAIESNEWPATYLGMDGTGVASGSSPGGSVSVSSAVGQNETFNFYTDLAIASQESPGVYLRMEGQTGGAVNCQSGVGAWEVFHLESQGSGTVAIKSKSWGVYLQLSASASANAPATFAANPGENGVFQLQRQTDGSVAIALAQSPGFYLG